jgi:hypothetical protein
MSCYLRIGGKDLDIDAFVGNTKMSGFDKYYKGSPVGGSKTRIRKNAVAQIATTKKDLDEINGQIADTTDFLNEYKENLLHILTTPEVEYAVIDFGVDSSLDEHHLIQGFLFPIRLLKICAELNIEIELSIYKQDMQVILERNHQKKKNAG